MTAPTVRTSTSQRRARLVMVVVALLSALGTISADLVTAEPAAAITPSIDFFRGETQAITADPAPGGSLNQLRATFVVQHDAGLTVNGMRTNRGINGGWSGWGGVGGTVRKVEGTNGIAYSVVEASFSPGTGNWPDFSCPVIGSKVRRRTGTAEIHLRLSNGTELPIQSWGYAAASESQCLSADEYPVPTDNYNTSVNETIGVGGSFHVAYSCDDNDGSGGGDNCDYANLRVRRLNDDATFDLTCVSGMACNSAAPTANFNADDNTRRDFDITHSSSWGTRGRFVIEGSFCQDGGCRSNGWSWLGSYEVNQDAPTVGLSGTATQAGTSTASSFAHPATNATVTATASASGDAQVIEWDLDNNGSFEVSEVGTGGSGSARTLTAGQLSRSINLNGRGAGTDCTVRARVRDNGAVSTSNYSAKTSGVQTLSCTTNRPPTGEPKTVTAHQGAPLSIALTNADPDFDSRTCVIVSGPTKGTLTSATGCAPTYTADLQPNTTDSFTYQVRDDHNGTSETYKVDINIVNGTPTATAQSLIVFAGEPTSINLAGTDPDGDSLSCAVTSAPTKGTLGGSGCGITYTSGSNGPNQGVGGSDTIGFTVSDGSATSSPANISVILRNPNLSVIKSHTGRFNEGVGTGTYTITVSNNNSAPAYGSTVITDTLPEGITFRSAGVGASEFSCAGTAVGATTVTCTRTTPIPRNSSIQVQLVVDVAQGTASPSINQVSVTNPYELPTTVSNNSGSDATDINRPPTITDQTVATAAGSPVDVTFTGVDPDGDELTYQTGSAGHGTVTGSGGTMTYTPEAGFQGVDSFVVQTTDSGTPGLSATATVTVWVGVRPLEGVVTSEQTGAPLEGIQVWLVNNADPANATIDQVITTGADGSYDFGLVPLGTYAIRWYDATETYISEFHLNAKNRAAGTNTVLTPGTTPVVRDAELTAGAVIKGTVASEDTGNAPIEGVQVRLVREGQTGGSSRDTGAAGTYEYRLLTAGTYQVWFRDMTTDRFHSEWYSGSPDQAGASTITIVAGQTATIDELLTPFAPPPPPDSGILSGTVRSAGPGNAPIPGIQVRAYREPYTGSISTTTDANGEYSFTRLPPGNWKVWFRDVAGTNYVSQYNGNASTLDDSDAVALNNDTKVVNVQLAPKTTPVTPITTGLLTGTVTEADGVTPVVGLQVRIFVNGTTTSRAVTTGADGTYTFTKVTPGSYQVWFRDLGRTWISEWHLDKPAQASAEPVPVVAGGTATVNAQLARK